MTATPTIIEGKFNQARIYAANVDEESLRQIKSFLDHEAFVSGKISIMPDVHAGKGAVIGFTCTLGPKVIPDVIGVDIGCGVKSWCLGAINVDFNLKNHSHTTC